MVASLSGESRIFSSEGPKAGDVCDLNVGAASMKASSDAFDLAQRGRQLRHGVNFMLVDVE